MGVAKAPEKERMRAVLLRRAVPILASRRLPYVLAATAILISLPALGTGLLTDDYMHRAMLTGDSEAVQQLSQVGLAPKGSGHLAPALSDLFVVVDPAKNLDRFRTYGNLPWWTSDGYRVAHWRPVASLTHWLDYRLFPNAVWLMHLHSILWFAAVVFLVALLYRRFIDTAWIAGLASVLYLLSDDSYFPTAWLANRNLLISLFFGIMTLIAHDRWRRDHWKPGIVAVPLCLLASMLATEGGIATFAYLFAYEAAMATGRPSKRILALLPSLAVIVLWRCFYSLQGYGATGGGFYLDPVRQPLSFLAAVARRAPVFLAGQWTTMPSELYGLLSPEGRMLLWCVLVPVALGIPLALWPLLGANRRARFWLLGMYGAVLPICATIPMSRALLFVAVGAFALVAECLAGWDRDLARVPRSGATGRWFRRLVIGLLIVHLPLAAATRGLSPKAMSKVQKRLKRTQAIGLFIRLRPHQNLVVMNAPNPASLSCDPFWAVYNDKGLPASIRMPIPGYGPLEITRTGPCRIVVKSLAGGFFDGNDGLRVDPAFFYRLLSDVRSSEHPLTVGTRVTQPPMTVEVLAVDERGRPSEIACEFETALEAPSLRWICWNWGRRHFEAFRPPPVGRAVCLPGPF